MEKPEITSRQKLRILYSTGPVDATTVYMNWATGQDDPSHFVIIYVQQFFELCRSLNAQGYVISCRDKRDFIRDQNFTITYRPLPYNKSHFILFYLGHLWSGLRLIFSAITFRADVVIVTQDRGFWFLFGILSILNIKVIPTLHCTLWPKHRRPKGIKQFLNWLNSQFFQHGCPAICVVSNEIATQIKEITNDSAKPIKIFVPTYRESRFDDILAPGQVNAHRETNEYFNVLFVGRLEVNKGIYLLLEVARQICQTHPHIIFDICGTGNELDSLQSKVSASGLTENFRCHGYCNQQKLRSMYGESAVVVVPTMTTFSEGLNKVVLEAILAGRPAITSSACPALELVKSAVFEVVPDQSSDYQDAILKLATDGDLYAEKVRQAKLIRKQFFACKNTWKHEVMEAIQMSSKC